MPYKSAVIVLHDIPFYTGRDAWKNKVTLSLNFSKDDRVTSFVQPFDYYELDLTGHDIRLVSDSIYGRFYFTLPNDRGSFAYSIAANIANGQINGTFETIKTPDQVVQGVISGKVSDEYLFRPDFELVQGDYPDFPQKPQEAPDIRYYHGNHYLVHQDTLVYQIDQDTIPGIIIQQVIDRCYDEGGGLVVVPPGKYLSGAIQLKSNVILYLEEGTEIIASEKREDYPEGFFIFAREANNVGIAGKGVINGNGFAWIDSTRIEYAHRTDAKRLYRKKVELAFWPTVLFIDCKDVFTHDFEIRNSPSFHLTFFGCQHVDVRGVFLNTPISMVRADGIDIIGSSHVSIRDCRIISGDDAICIKGNHVWKGMANNQPTHDVFVDNCVLTTSCNGFKTGTETQYDIFNIHFSNSIIYNHPGEGLNAASAISLTAVDGGNLYKVFIDSIQVYHTKTPVFLRLGMRNRDNPTGRSSMTGIVIQHLYAEGTTEPISMHGIPDLPIGSVGMRHIELVMAYEETRDIVSEPPNPIDIYPNADRFGVFPAWALYARHVDSLDIHQFSAVNERHDNRNGILLENIGHKNLSNILVSPSK